MILPRRRRRRPFIAPLIAIAPVLLAVTLGAGGCGQAPNQTPANMRTSGDPRAGLSVYKFAGCAPCHSIANVSTGTTGPALDGEGGRRSAAWLRTVLPAHLRAEGLAPLSARDRADLVSYLTSLR